MEKKTLTLNSFDSMPMSQLLNWYNANCLHYEKVKTFRTLANGVLRCKQLFTRIENQREFESETEKLSDAEFQEKMRQEINANSWGKNPAIIDAVRKSLDESTIIQDVELRRVTIVTPKAKTVNDKKTHADAVRDSWKDETVSHKRTTRNHVYVTHNGVKERFRSVRVAFEFYGLPLTKHIRFRKNLKERGELAFEWNNETFNFIVIK